MQIASAKGSTSQHSAAGGQLAADYSGATMGNAGVISTIEEPTLEAIRASRKEVPRVIRPKPQLEITDTELRARVSLGQKTSNHFLLAYDKIFFSEVHASQILAMLESSYSSIFSLTHESFGDRFQVYAIDQRSKGLLGHVVRSHMNLAERAIYLARTPTQPIHTDMIAELVHAMRLVRYAKHYNTTPGWAMLEDGFGVFLNTRLTTLREVFPFYGVEADVIAYHIYQRRITRPIRESWEASECAQTLERHVLAGAFLLYLGDTFSDDRVVEFSKVDCDVTNGAFKAFFGRTLEELEQTWLNHLPHSLISLTNEEQLASVQHWLRSIEGRCEGLSVHFTF